MEFTRIEGTLKIKISDLEREQALLKQTNTNLTAQLAAARTDSEAVIAEKDIIINELRGELATSRSKFEEFAAKKEETVGELEHQIQALKLEAQTAKKEKELALKETSTLSTITQVDDEEGDASYDEVYSETPAPYASKPAESSSQSSSSTISSLTVSVSGGFNKLAEETESSGELLYNDERATLGEESYEMVEK
jgi:hypothetical protein